MSVLTREEYRKLFEAVDEFREVVSVFSDGGLSVDFDDRPEEVEELNSVGAAFYRSDHEISMLLRVIWERRP